MVSVRATSLWRGVHTAANVAVSPGQHLAVGRMRVDMQTEIMAGVADHGCLDACRGAELALLKSLHRGIVGAVKVQLRAAEELFVLTDDHLHRAGNLA